MYKIFEKIRNKINKFEYIPKVKNFNEANLFCQNKNSGVYESELLCKYRFEKLDNYLKKNEILFNPLASNMLLVCIAYFLKNNKGRFPKIIDYGGACGENILFLETIFGNDIFGNSWIIETPGQVDESRKWKFAKKLNFSSDINTILKYLRASLTIGCFIELIELQNSTLLQFILYLYSWMRSRVVFAKVSE